MTLTKTSETQYIYEVNLTIEKSIFMEQRSWLIEHFHEMVEKNNFIRLNLFYVKNTNPIDDNHLRYCSVVAQYWIANYQILQTYLEKQAQTMRSQVIEKLGCKYSVSRRVLEVVEQFCTRET